MIKTEYLLPFNSEDGQCKSVVAFNSLLESNTDISTTKNKIKFKGSEYSYKVELTEITDKKCSVFHVTFEATKLTDKFRELLRIFRKTVTPHLQDNIQIIWDGVSFEWSKELYPLIYEVENSMRKLISKFMLTKLGIGWHKSTVPKEVEKSIKTANYKPSHGVLYEVDFIQLSNFLFESYSLKDINKLPASLTDIIKNGLTEEKKKEIQDYIPISNWDRYFSDLVECESEELKKKWEKLYEIRCKVAHNKSMSIDDVKSAKELCQTLNQIISKALSKLIKIEIPEEQKESVSLHTIATVNDPTKDYVSKYLNFNTEFSDLIYKNNDKITFDLDYKSPLSSLLYSAEAGSVFLPDNLKSNLFNIENQKNIILSGDISPNLIHFKDSDYILGNTASSLVDYFKFDNSANEFLKLFPNKDKESDDNSDEKK
jgi:hypothetical protein